MLPRNYFTSRGRARPSTDEMTGAMNAPVEVTLDGPLHTSQYLNSESGSAAYHSQNNTNGSFFAASAPAGSQHAVKMLELMAAIQGQPQPSQRRCIEEEHIQGRQSIQAPLQPEYDHEPGVQEAKPAKWSLPSWITCRGEHSRTTDQVVSTVPQMRMQRVRTTSDVQYMAQTEHGTMYVSVPRNSPEAHFFDQTTVQEPSESSCSSRKHARQD